MLDCGPTPRIGKLGHIDNLNAAPLHQNLLGQLRESVQKEERVDHMAVGGSKTMRNVRCVCDGQKIDRRTSSQHSLDGR